MIYRLAIPLLLALVSVTVFFRVLLLLALALVFAGILLLVARVSGKRMGKVGQTAKEGKKFIDGRYKIVDDNEEPPK
jgi:uncharacterized membrane protein